MKESKSPQLENGYTRIANEIMDELCKFRMAGEARQVLDFIIRKTYGFHKKEERLSNSQMVFGTGLNKGRVSLYLSQLVLHCLVTKSGNKLCLNKDYSKWISFKKLPKMVTNKVLPKMVTTVTKDGNKSLPLVVTPTVLNIKDTLKIRQKRYFTPLSLTEKEKIAGDLKVKMEVVDEYCDQADAWSNGKGNKALNWYLTVRNWINRDIKLGKIKQTLTQDEELGLMAKEIGIDVSKY